MMRCGVCGERIWPWQRSKGWDNPRHWKCIVEQWQAMGRMFDEMHEKHMERRRRWDTIQQNRRAMGLIP